MAMNKNLPFLLLCAAVIIPSQLLGALPDGSGDVRLEANGIAQPHGYPGPKDEDDARANAIRSMVLVTLERHAQITPAQRREIDAALPECDLATLRRFLRAPEEVISGKRRAGYIELRVTADVRADAVVKWAVQFAGEHPIKKLRVMVVIPEVHLQRPIPDPAGETQVIASLLREGFRVVDQKQVEAIRDKDLVKRAAKGDPKELLAIAQTWGAELVLIGEAFSQEVTADRSVTGGQSACRARIEARLIQCDTAEILTSADGDAGEIDLSPAVAAKAAIREAAKKMADTMIADLLIHKTGKAAQQRARVILTGADFEQKLEFVGVLRSLEGIVTEVEELSYLDNRSEIDVVCSLSSADLAQEILGAAKERNLLIRVAEQSSRRCVFELKPAPTSNPAK